MSAAGSAARSPGAGLCALVDYGMGNLHSLAKAFGAVAPDMPVTVSADRECLLGAERLVLPGVGAARDCMAAIVERGLDRTLREAARDKPLLGICIGMHLLQERSDENDGVACMGLLRGRAHRLKAGAGAKIPNMGWSRVEQRVEHPLWSDIPQNAWFYFLHSYAVTPAEDGAVAAVAKHAEPFCAAQRQENMFGVQFHPEKSGVAGLRLLRNFCRWRP